MIRHLARLCAAALDAGCDIYAPAHGQAFYVVRGSHCSHCSAVAVEVDDRGYNMLSDELHEPDEHTVDVERVIAKARGA